MEKRIETINNYLFNNYDLKINNYEKIKFRPFPVPNLEFKNTNINFTNVPSEINVSKFKSISKTFSIFNFKNFKLKKKNYFKKIVNFFLRSFKFKKYFHKIIQTIK